MSYAFGVEIDLPFDAAVERVVSALAAEKLGIVSDVDVAAILKAKLNEDIGGYRILGACAPGLAKRVVRPSRRPVHCCLATWSCVRCPRPAPPWTSWTRLPCSP